MEGSINKKDGCFFSVQDPFRTHVHSYQILDTKLQQKIIGGVSGLGGPEWSRIRLGQQRKIVPENTDEIHKSQAHLKSKAGMQKVDKKNQI